ncbi:rRNA adenine N-6-methyltransferase family protein [Nonomuraea sp. NPDC049400]|uniref:rRNA adenine N-6-methyltransferase family protein n=1 Tax=Nonomuraea sp. NPDC049400 TaxID=3364352 RepID=UPI0037A73F59
MTIDPRLPALLEGLVNTLVQERVLRPDRPQGDWWMQGIRAVPRHAFLPARAWVPPHDGQGGHDIDRNQNPHDWWNAAYRDSLVVTRREGDDVADVSSPPTCVLSRPSTVFRLLRLLDPMPHDRVMEMGTGTGYTAALLAWLIGGDQVTTIEIDPGLAAVARQNLQRTGFNPITLVRDGSLGSGVRERFSRVHITCGVPSVPRRLLEQTNPGGVIVLPWMPPHGQRGEMLRLTVTQDQHAIGHFHGATTFIPMRTQIQANRPASPAGSLEEGEGDVSYPRLPPSTVHEAIPHGFGIWLTAQAPHVAITSTGWEDRDGSRRWVMRLRSTRDDSGAVVVADPLGTLDEGKREVRVTQSGERLWDDLEAAYMSWQEAQRPGRDRLGLSITSTHETIWLDEPGRSVA